MLPKYILELADTNIRKDYYKTFFNEQYPQTNDCIVLDKQIKDIQIDKADLEYRKATNYLEFNGPMIIQVPCTNTGFSINCIGGINSKPNPDYSNSILLRNKAIEYL